MERLSREDREEATRLSWLKRDITPYINNYYSPASRLRRTSHKSTYSVPMSIIPSCDSSKRPRIFGCTNSQSGKRQLRLEARPAPRELSHPEGRIPDPIRGASDRVIAWRSQAKSRHYFFKNRWAKCSILYIFWLVKRCRPVLCSKSITVL